VVLHTVLCRASANTGTDAADSSAEAATYGTSLAGIPLSAEDEATLHSWWKMDEISDEQDAALRRSLSDEGVEVFKALKYDKRNLQKFAIVPKRFIHWSVY